MKMGFRGTFVISWAQTEIDGRCLAPMSDILPGAIWTWHGEAVRIDGPAGILPLCTPEDQIDLHQRAAHNVRRLFGSLDIDVPIARPLPLEDPLFEAHFIVTNGKATWNVALITKEAGQQPLLMFHDEIPPRDAPLWIVRHNLDASLKNEGLRASGGVICFTPGTMIQTARGPRDVASLREGDLVQTKDNGLSEILWLGQRHVNGARLNAMPALLPVRFRANALDHEVPDASLLVSPDHRIVLTGARAKALFQQDEVLVAARDLINDHSIIRDHSVHAVTYIHMLLASHEIVFANGVETESFHPASAALATMQERDKRRLFDKLPEIEAAPDTYGPYARRVLDQSETAILRADVAGYC